MTKILKDGCQAAFDGVVSTAVYSRLPNAHHQVFVRGRQFNALQTDWGSAALFIKSEEESTESEGMGDDESLEPEAKECGSESGSPAVDDPDSGTESDGRLTAGCLDSSIL